MTLGGTTAGRHDRRGIAAWVAILSLILNIVAPALTGGAVAAAAPVWPFADDAICTVHDGDAGASAPMAPTHHGDRPCPLCLLQGHHGAFVPAEAAMPAYEGVARRFVPAGVAARPALAVAPGGHSARGPPLAV